MRRAVGATGGRPAVGPSTRYDLKILVIGKFYPDSFASELDRGLRELGHATAGFEMGRRVRPADGRLRGRIERAGRVLDRGLATLRWFRERGEAQLLARARAVRPDLVLLAYDWLRPREVEALRRAAGAPVVLWFPDAIGNLTAGQALHAPYDALFFKDPYIVDVAGRMLDRPVFYLPECAFPVPEEERRAETEARFVCEIATAGNPYPYRLEFFRQLADRDVKIWGHPAPAWADSPEVLRMIQGHYVTGPEKTRAFRDARIVVNNLNPTEIWGVNKRTFEVAAAGGFQLVDWRPALAALFVDGEELVTFRSREELRERVERYLARDDERRAIAERGRVRLERDHTYAIRLQTLLDTVAGDAKGHPVSPPPW